jgi:hypothetical protein
MSDSDERMLEGDSPEVISKTGNTTTEEVTNAIGMTNCQVSRKT